MERAKGFFLPIQPDRVLSPTVFYGDPVTGIYFITDDEQHGRITFEKLDSLKISRGEYLPYPDDWEQSKPICWVTKVENSHWLEERYHYEKEQYGSTYEWGGSVEEMMTDYSHYVFSFHDQFVEAIARGIWFEKDSKSLFRRKLQAKHPSLALSEDNIVKFVAHNLTCRVRINSESITVLEKNALYCSQKIMEFIIEVPGNASIDFDLILVYRNAKLVTILRGFFGKPIMQWDRIATMDDVKPYVEKRMYEL